MEILTADQPCKCADNGVYSPYGLAFLIVINFIFISE